MKTAFYSVIRYVADPVRNEPLNIGLVSWLESEHRVLVNEKALQRALTYNPSLDPASLDYVEATIASELDAIASHCWDAERLYPLLLSDPLRIWIDDSSFDVTTQWQQELSEIEKDIVVPRVRRSSSNRTSSAKRQLATAYRPLIEAHRMYIDYPVDNTKTGILRKADFYLNAGSDTAVQVLSLKAKATLDTVRKELDALRWDAEDILYSPRIRRVVAHVSRPETQQDFEVTEHIQRILHGDGITVTEGVKENLRLINKLAGDPPVAD